jgi:probable rRNA maturation factor
MISSNTELLIVDVQNALEETDNEEPPSRQALSKWAQLAFREGCDTLVKQASEVTLRLVEEAEMVELNTQFRNKNSPTNVLSFAVEYDSNMHLEARLLGDIVLCHPVIASQAFETETSLDDHYAHMVTHGILHLQGFDHQDKQSADEMEACEAQILALSGISNPYAV